MEYPEEKIQEYIDEYNTKAYISQVSQVSKIQSPIITTVSPNSTGITANSIMVSSDDYIYKDFTEIGNIKVGDLIITAKEFELCLKHLLDITKQEHPEEFI